MRCRLLSSILVLVALSGDVIVAAEPPAALVADFANNVRPLLEAKCVSCHGTEKQEGNLRLDSRSALEAGGDRGPAIVPGDLQKSLLVHAISFRDPDFQMPPGQKLSDSDISTLTEWVQAGAVWPDPVVVLFEDQTQFLTELVNGSGTGRLTVEAPFAGKAAIGITPLQRDNGQIPGWNFTIREKPQRDEYRYLRLAWKKQGEGSVMIELAADGKWPDAQVANGRYVAGVNTTGWAAVSVSETAPVEWTVATFDLWKDIGDFTLTGIAPTCDQGEEAFFDSIILGPTMASLEAYRPDAALAIDPADEVSFGDALTDERNPIRRLFRGERLDLWSLQMPRERQMESTQQRTGQKPSQNAETHSTAGMAESIDDLIRQRLARDDLQLAPEADRRTLIRRLTFDLIGLPPTPDEVTAFVSDDAPDAYEKLVVRLLQSPRYGERQARLWLDVVRYADTNGYERDEFRPLAWQYRDYVIRSFNQDKPFDRFIVEQLAGDVLVNGLPKNTAEADMLIATGYLRLGQWDSTASIFQEEARLQAEIMADLTNTTASAFLGLTMSCCQCHDHKYDPLSQADHFRFRAFFAGVMPRDDLPISVVDEQAEIDAHNAELDRQAAPFRAELETLDEANKERHEELRLKLAEIEAEKRQPCFAMGVTESASPAATHILYQGDFASPREEVLPGIPTVLGTDRCGSRREPASETSDRFTSSDAWSEFERLVAERSAAGDNRRLTLAKWIASGENPWTARVIVNRIWQQHFGTGIVATPNDFGYSGARPSHPELLDWLSLEFMRRGWSIKELHRLIVMSATYRQSSRATPGQRTVDPEGILPGRQSVRRLDAETLRDALLAVSGLLRPCESGRPLWPPVPEELLHAQPAILEAEKGGDGGRRQGWYADPIEQTDVRSVFLVRKRCLPIPFLQAFDLPDTTVSCARRDTTVVAPQALMLLNSPEGLRCAEALATRVSKTTDSLDYADAAGTKDLVRYLFQLTLNRIPTPQEDSLAIELLRRHTLLHQEAGDRARLLALTDLCRAVLNLNEFAYID